MDNTLSTTRELVLEAARLGDRERECLKKVFPDAFKRQYPYVGVYENDPQVVLFEREKEGRKINEVGYNRFGTFDDQWLEKMFSPFTGTIHYKNGQPVKTIKD